MILSYTDPTNRCSIMGENTISIDKMYTRVAFRGIAMLRLNESTFSETVNCTWNDLAQLLNCPCPVIYQYSLSLPRIFRFSLFFEEYGWAYSTHALTDPYIIYDDIG